MLDLTGKPYPDVTLIITNIETNKTVDVKTDAKGHYAVAGVAGGNLQHRLEGKDKDQKIDLIRRV